MPMTKKTSLLSAIRRNSDGNTYREEASEKMPINDIITRIVASVTPTSEALVSSSALNSANTITR